MKSSTVLGLLLLLARHSSEDDADRPVIKANNGDLIIEPADGRSVYIRTRGHNSKIYADDVDLTQALRGNLTRYDPGGSSSEDAGAVVTYITGPGGLLSRMSRLERRSSVTGNDSSSDILRYRGRVNSLSRQVQALAAQIHEILNSNGCSSGPCKNGGTCQRVVDGYFCQCPVNWEGKDCDVDVNECRNFAGTDLGCQNGATCINRQGSYECLCTSGWFGFHCTRRAQDCSGGDDEMCGHGTCLPVTTGSGIVCICHQGWKQNDTHHACAIDVDECTESTKTHCSVNPPVECINLPGSFRCGSCPRGYQGDGFKCFDIDECAVDNGGCSKNPLVNCHNTIGSRMCGACPPGYQGDGTSCAWRGSCSFSRGGCHPSATCVENLAVSAQFVQCVCPTGMAGDGVGIGGCYIPSRNSSTADCSGNPCGQHGQCYELERGITCICGEGYTGPYCDLPKNYCADNPCKNGGICKLDTSATGYRCECTALYSGETCQNHARTCGDVLDSQEGSIMYPLPNTSSTYNHNSRCVWLIQTAHNKVINVTFSKFDLEVSRTCTFDFLQIHDGRSSASQLIGRYCGNDLPKGGNIISSHNTLYFWFRSDQTVSHEGFSLHWTSIDPVCGGEVDATTHGAISSPGSPGNYPPNRDCNWHLSSDLGKRIQLVFFRIGLEAHPNCSFDYLEIFDGAHSSDPLLQRYCNTSQPAPLQSAGSEILIHFHSDGYNSGEGFQIAYKPVEGVPGCGGLYTQEKGEITPPSYNGRYSHDLLCDYKIQVTPDTKISIRFLDFELERSFGCRFDYLSIYDGASSDSKFIGKYCGRNKPSNFVSTSNTIFMQFKTDSTLARGGFRIAYEIICQETFTEETGVLKSPGYPQSYPSNRICEYFISVAPSKAIRLSFQHFDIEDNKYYDCQYDHLEIRDGPNVNSTLINTYCDQNIPAMQMSTHNFMYLKFVTDFSISGTGFLANYSTVDVTCGGIYTARTGVISHPMDDQEHYENGQECTWIILAPPGHNIRITWTRFDLEQISNTCWADYLEMSEGQNSEDNYGRFCGSNFPPSITTISNQLKINFVSDDSIRSSGFSFTYVISDSKIQCGGTYLTPHGSLHSPGWPAEYLANRDCVWIISARYGQQIMLNVSTFDLERTRSCSDDYLEIRNGQANTSPMVGKYCGVSIPRKITSHGNSLYLHFHSDSYLGGRGFKIEWDGTTTGCGGTLTGSSGAISSPNYPQPYSEDSECFWKIIVSVGSVVSINFIDVDMEHSSSCFADYIEIYDGRDASAKVLGRYCSMDHRTSAVKSSTNQVFIKFRSDVSVQGKGFSLTYFTNCNNAVSGYSGVIESPNFPNEYPTNLDCLWTVNAPKGNTINATFTTLDLPERLYNFHVWNRPYYGTRRPAFLINRGPDNVVYDKCNNGYVQLKDGKDNNFNNKICGSTIPSKYVTRDNTLNLKFISGQYFSKSGFRLEWIVEGCGGTIRKPFGNIVPPAHRRGVQDATECEWVIDTPFGTSIQMFISDLNMIDSPNCTVDSIELYNGMNALAPLLMKICHRQVMAYQVASTSNLLFMRYSSTSGYAALDFKAHFFTATAKCGGRFVGTSGSFTSPNYPKNYDSKTNCEWLIRVPQNHRIQLDITDLDLYSVLYEDDSCHDTVEIFEGSIIDKLNYTSKYCPKDNSDSVKSFISKGNVIIVQFKSGDEGAKGFKANFSMVCGSQLTSRGEGILKNYPSAAMHSNINCTWTITAEKPEQKVSVTFTHMILRTSMEADTNRRCSSDFLKIFDGNDVQAPMKSEYCSRKIPPTIVSHGNSITIQLGSYNGSVTGEFSAHYSVLDTACGGTLVSEEGTIASPDYPETYSMSTDCVWLLKTSPGNKVWLNFEKFDLESSPNCNEDYVEVRETDGGGKILGAYCGNEVPVVGTVAAQLYIKFHSDGSGTAPGFLAHYGFVHGNDVTGQTSGAVSSPLFPLYYHGAGDFSWRITTNASTYISLTLSQIEIDVRGRVCYNHLSIYDGYDSTAPFLKQFCGLLNEDEKDVRTTSNMVYIRMVLDDSNARSLFYLNWMEVEKKALETNPITKNNCGTNQTVNVNPYQSLQINSPKYPANYDDNLDCEYEYQTTPGRHLLIKFTDFHLEQSEDCIMDYVQIYSGVDGTNDWHSVSEKLCLPTVTSNDSLITTNLMKVVFHSDPYLSKSGFQGTVYSVCGGVLTESSGVIEATHSDRNRFGVITNCTWLVKVKPRRTIAVRFERFHVPGSSDGSCKTNNVILRNGASIESPFLSSPSSTRTKYCGENIPEVDQLETSGNTLLVTFTTVFMNPLDGFRLAYEEKSIDCGSSFKLDSIETSRVIHSLNYPQPPLPYSDCEWSVMGPPGEVLRLEFIEQFDLAGPVGSECVKEYVEIRDGSSESSPLLGRHCDRNTISTIKTTGNAIYVKYVTLLLSPGDGFKANISVDMCGATLRTSYGEITSPGYPKYPYLPIGTVCEWKLISPMGNSLWINLRDLSLPESEDPCATKIVVEGFLPANKSTLVQKTFCSDEDDISPIRSISNEVIIKFYVQKPTIGIDTSHFKGFRLNFNATGGSCGGKINSPSGYIESPGYPQRMTMRYCTWEIEVPDTSRRIRLEFLDIDAAGNDPVIGIYNDFGYRAPLVFIPGTDWDSSRKVFESSGNTISVNVRSRANSIRRGFRARFTSDEPAICGGLLREEFGSVTSPPAMANQSYYCQWRISPERTDDAGSQTSLGTNITIYININLTSTGSWTRHYCRYLSPFIHISPGTEQSDGSYFVRENCNTEVDILRLPIPSVKINAYQSRGQTLNFNITWKVQPCGGSIEVGDDDVDLLNLPTDYNDSLDCAWFVKIQPGKLVQMALEGTFSSPCSEEYMRVYQSMNKNAPALDEYCHSKSATPLVLHYKSFYIQYHSDRYSNATNIKLKSSVGNSKACGGVLSGYERVLMTPNYPKSYSENQECTWDISTSLGNRISLKFEGRFHIEDTVNCTKDYVLVLDRQNDDYTQIDRFCGRNKPQNINSTSNRMKVIFRSDSGVNADGFRAWWNPICGGEYTATENEQYLYSPNYPEYYTRNLDCKYKIKATGKKVVIKFIYFNLESTSGGNCDFDNLTVTGFELWGPIETYCGEEAPQTRSYQDGVNLHFSTDGSIQRRGFKIMYKIKTCGGEIKNHSVITSGEEGGAYEDNLNCVWNISAPTNKNVVVRYSHFDLEGSSDCSTDYVAVYNGSEIVEDQLLSRLCGRLNSTLPVLKSSGPSMIIRFVSDYGLNYNGFKAEVFFSYGVSVGCGGEIDLTNGNQRILKSPKLPGAHVYEKYLDCHWSVKAPADKVIKIEFTAFNIAPCMNTNQTAIGFSNCTCDSVSIRDGANPTSPTIGTYCGYNIPRKLTSSSNYMFIMLYTDGDTESGGFEANLSVVESQCGKQHFVANNSSQHIKSPQYDFGYVPRGLHCTYHITESEGKRVHIKIKKLNLEPESSDTHECTRDKLIITGFTMHNNVTVGKNLILNGNSLFRDYSVEYLFEMSTPHMLQTLCGDAESLDIYVYDSVTLRLFTEAADSGRTYRGFDIELTHSDDCVRNYTEPQGRILSPTSTDDEHCYTLITAPVNRTVSAYFFQVMSYWSEEGLFLEVRDGDRSDSPLLARVTGPEGTLTAAFSTGRNMLIHRQTKTPYYAIGYDLNYVTTDKGPGCGGKLHGVVGTVTSPMYPEPYRAVKSCEFELQSTSNTKLKLRFKNFDLGTRATCDQVYVQLVDRAGAAVRSYCSDDAPADYTSPDNYVKIIYHTTMNTGGSGWVALFVGVPKTAV